jgi:hypothetical protein
MSGVTNQLLEAGNLASQRKNTDNSINDAKMIALIIKLLNQGKYVIYNPVSKPGYDVRYYNALKTKLDVYKSLEFVFVPEIQSYDFGDFFKPAIKINMPMFFCPGNDILVKCLSMFLSLDDLSNYINNGSYEIVSRIRMGYLFLPKNRQAVENQITSGGGLDEYMDDYENGLEDMYGNKMTGGIKMKHTKTYRRKKHKKNKTIRRRHKK